MTRHPSESRPLGWRQIAFTDADLEEINGLLNWQAGTILPDGRILGRVGVHKKKFATPVPVPSSRVKQLNKLVPLKDQRVLELGCGEGIHTVGLCAFTEKVVSLDARPENVVKTLVRASWYGGSANVYQANVEFMNDTFGLFDVIYHSGLLYHLSHPVEHLASLRPITEHLYLDTHVADEDSTDLFRFRAGEHSYSGKVYKEFGWQDPFSGVDSTATWLTLKSLLQALKSAGFGTIEIVDQREERNGSRCTILVK